MRQWFFGVLAVLLISCGGQVGSEAELGDEPQGEEQTSEASETEELGTVEQGLYYKWHAVCPSGTYRIAFCTQLHQGVTGCARYSDRRHVVTAYTYCRGCTDVGDQLRCQ